MLDKSLITAVGEFLREEREVTDKKLGELSELLHEKLSSTDADGFMGDIRVLVALQAEKTEKDVEQIKSLQSSLQDALKNISDGKDGQPGEKGQDGLAGKDGKDVSPDEVVKVLKADDEFIGAIKGLPGEKGNDGIPGDKGIQGTPGNDGKDGIGLNLKHWEKGIYREGVLVNDNIGQTFKALKDTSEKTSHEDWERIGVAGFRWLGVKPKDFTFREGDLYIDKGTTFIYMSGKGRMFAQRGIDGAIGKDGKPAPQVVDITMTMKKATFVFDDGSLFTSDLEGLDDIVKGIRNSLLKEIDGLIEEKALSVFEQQDTSLLEFGTPIRVYRGFWNPETKYSVGDVFRIGKKFKIVTKELPRGSTDPDAITDFGGGGGIGSDIGKAANVVSPFNVLTLTAGLPRAGVGNGDAYFSFEDKLLRIWDAAKNQWTIPTGLAGSYATDTLANTGAGQPGEMRWSEGSKTLWVWDVGTNTWVKSSSGIAHVADAAARTTYTPTTPGEVVIQDDTAELWHYVRVPGGALQWLPIMPSPADNSMLRALVWDPSDPSIIHWRDERDALLTVADNAAMFAIPIPHLQTGKLVYNQNAGKLYEFVASPTTLTRTITDWKEAGGASGAVQVYNRIADLPQNTPAGTPMPPYSMGYVRFHADATTPLGEMFIAVPGATPPAVNWQQIASSVFTKTTLAGVDVPDPQPNDIQLTTEAGHKEVKIFDGGTNAWITIYSEDQIQSWIAAGNLFTGTAEETGHGTAGAIDVANMPAQSALGPTDKGHYWVWVGTAGHALVANDIGGAASAIDGQVLNVGDWIQVSEPTTGNYQYSVIPGDLLSKATADSLFGLNTWVQGAAQAGTLVSHNGSIYKAGAAILATDLAPDDATNTKWVKVNISAGVHNVPADNNLPPTAPTGEVYLVVNSARNNGAPAFYIYDTPSAQWLNIGGGGGGGGGGATGQPMNLMGGELLYNTGTPIGSVTMWPVDIPPDGWLICNGSAFDGVRYPILMQLLNDNHTPDLQGQFIRGATGALDNFAKHQWTTGKPRVPFKTDDPGTHNHTYNSGHRGSWAIGRGSSVDPGEIGRQDTQSGSSQSGAHTHTITGGGDPETAPDHVTLHYIIKAEDMGLEKRII